MCDFVCGMFGQFLKQILRKTRKMCDFVLQNVWVIFETNFEKNMGENVDFVL